MGPTGRDSPARVCIGIDIGGTFTDAVLADGDAIWRAKAPTTAGDPGRGVLDACRLAAQRAGTTLEADRLARATPPRRPLLDADVATLSDGHETLPLYPGIVQRGPVAFAEASGAPLALAPDHWTDGCVVFEERRPGPGPEITVRAYLDPVTGASLYVEAVPAGEPRSFEVSPDRWTSMAPGARTP